MQIRTAVLCVMKADENLQKNKAESKTFAAEKAQILFINSKIAKNVQRTLDHREYVMAFKCELSSRRWSHVSSG